MITLFISITIIGILSVTISMSSLIVSKRFDNSELFKTKENR